MLKNITEFLKFKVGFPLLVAIEKMIGNFSILGNPTIFNNDKFPWVKSMEKNWPLIREELEKIMVHHQQLPNLQDIQAEQYEITSDNKWKTFILYGFGHKSELNCQLCPKTTELIETIPDMVTAFFSILSPDKHIPRHRGVYKGLIRSHLGLIVPQPKGICRMNVGNETVEWEEGKMVVFDNTYHHEVWNNSDNVRVVLLIDVIRPFRFPFSAINRGLVNLIKLTSYVKAAKKNHDKWENDFEKSKGLKKVPN